MKMPLKKRVKNKGEQNTSLKTKLFVRRNKMCLIYIWQIMGSTSRKKELAMK